MNVIIPSELRDLFLQFSPVFLWFDLLFIEKDLEYIYKEKLLLIKIF